MTAAELIAAQRLVRRAPIGESVVEAILDLVRAARPGEGDPRKPWVEQKLPGIEKAYRARIRQMREEQRTGMVKPTEEQAKVEAMFPAIARYVQGYGYVEIGDQESFGFVVRALGYGGLDFEDDTPETLAEAMAVLEAGLSKWFEEQGIELD